MRQRAKERNARTEARATIARQVEEIACLRRLVFELARRAEPAPESDPGGPVRSAVELSPAGGAGQLLADDALDEPGADWSTPFAPGVLPAVSRIRPIDDIGPDWAWGGSTGRGVKVAVIDSGIHAGHPAIGGRVSGYVTIEQGPEGLAFEMAPHGDAHGHGTACAGIIRSLAPDCELYSVRVLGPELDGSGAAFAAALRWAIDNGMQVCNLSLGTTCEELNGPLHDLADEAYFRNVILVTAANNQGLRSFPAAYASVIAVAAVESDDPHRFYYNPRPPIEFGAAGIGVRVAWPKRRWIVESGNSFAAPQITGLVAKILGKHPGLTPFQLKSVLRALAANVSGGSR